MGCSLSSHLRSHLHRKELLSRTSSAKVLLNYKEYVHLQLFCWFDMATREVAHSSRAARFAQLGRPRHGQVRGARPIQWKGSEWLATTDGRMDGCREGRN